MPLLARMRESVWSWVSPASSARKKTSRDAIAKKKTPSKSTRNAAPISPPWTGGDDSTLVATSPASPAEKKQQMTGNLSDASYEDSSDEEGSVPPPPRRVPLLPRLARKDVYSAPSDESSDDDLDAKFGKDDLLDDEPISPTVLARNTLQQEREMVENGWQRDEIDLFFELDHRGSKPLFPDNWCERDLPTIPLELFATEAQEGDFFMIKQYKGTEFRAIRAVSDLIDLGPLVRDTYDSTGDPERMLNRGVQAFWKWAKYDAGLNDDEDIPNLVIVSGDRSTSTAKLKSSMQRSAEKLAARFEHVLEEEGDLKTGQNPVGGKARKIPNIYGLIVSHTVFAIVSYNASRPEDDSLRTLGVYNYADMPMDVWNSIAIMCLIVHCRDKLVEFWDPAPARNTSAE